MTGEAVKYLVEVALTPSHGSRLLQKNVRTVAVVITDGRSQDYHRGTLSKWQKIGKVRFCCVCRCCCSCYTFTRTDPPLLCEKCLVEWAELRKKLFETDRRSLPAHSLSSNSNLLRLQRRL